MEKSVFDRFETKSTALVPLNYQPPINFVSDKAHLPSLARMNIAKAALKLRICLMLQSINSGGKPEKIIIPQRPYLQLTDDDFEEILDAAENFLE